DPPACFPRPVDRTARRRPGGEPGREGRRDAAAAHRRPAGRGLRLAPCRRGGFRNAPRRRRPGRRGGVPPLARRPRRRHPLCLRPRHPRRRDGREPCRRAHPGDARDRDAGPDAPLPRRGAAGRARHHPALGRRGDALRGPDPRLRRRQQVGQLCLPRPCPTQLREAADELPVRRAGGGGAAAPDARRRAGRGDPV
ncbi:MAG: hypothetical protein AVDCRST_MAG27-3812, partial [uncultured Craurococcus sp.]